MFLPEFGLAFGEIRPSVFQPPKEQPDEVCHTNNYYQRNGRVHAMREENARVVKTVNKIIH
jgi:hypothetical protein